MTPAPARSIFISYATSDGTEQAKLLYEQLTARGLKPWIDRSGLIPGMNWTVEIEQAIDGCGAMLALLSPRSYTSAICRSEHMRALRLKKRVIPMLLNSSAPVPLYFEVAQRLDLSASDALDRLIACLAGNESAKLAPTYRTTYVTAPPSPPGWRRDSEGATDLIAKIVAENPAPRMRTVAVYGRGQGPRTAAAGVCHESSVQCAFPDAVVWVDAPTTREEALEQLREVGKALRDDLTRYDSVTGAKNQIRTTLSGRSVLLVVNGANDWEQLELVMTDSPGSTLVFPTKSWELAQKADAIVNLDAPPQPKPSPALFVLAVAAAVCVFSIVDERQMLEISHNPVQQAIERGHIWMEDAIGWLLTIGAFLGWITLWRAEKKRLFVRSRVRGRLVRSLELFAGAAVCMIFRDIRVALSLPGTLASSPTFAWPFWLAVCYSGLALGIMVRTIWEDAK